MRAGRTSLGAVLYAVIGFLVAGSHGFYGDLSSASGILSALAAIILWPLVLFNVHVMIRI